MTSRQDRNNLNDGFYLEESFLKEPKETFKFVANAASHLPIEISSWHDIGCGTGDFLFYLRTVFKGLEASGSDISPDLIKVARHKHPSISFSVADFTQPHPVAQPKYDVVSMVGVHGRFRTVDEWVPHFSSLVQQGGYGLIFDLFNPNPVDVSVEASAAQDRGAGFAPTYFNLPSMITTKSAFASLGFDASFSRFEMPFAIEKRDDPFRSWTVDLSSGERMLTNGLGQLFDLYLCLVTR